jgi:hypothetical protein
MRLKFRSSRRRVALFTAEIVIRTIEHQDFKSIENLEVKSRTSFLTLENYIQNFINFLRDNIDETSRVLVKSIVILSSK